MVFYFYGDNSYAMANAVAQIKRRYADKTATGLDVTVFDASEQPMSDLLNALSVQPMFADTRLIIARNLGGSATAREQINAILEAVPTSTVLVITDAEVDKRSSYFKRLSKLENAREFAPLNPVQMRSWIAAEVKKLGGEIDNLSTQKLYETAAHEYKPRDREQMRKAGQDQWRLRQELQKLVSFDPKITPESITELVVPAPEQTIFELVEAVTRGQRQQAMQIYGNLRWHGTSEQQVLAMLNWQYRVLVLAKENLGRDESWTREFGLSPYALNRARQIADSLDFEQLKTAYELMVAADFSIKTGEKSPDLALEELIWQLCD